MTTEKQPLCCSKLQFPNKTIDEINGFEGLGVE
jgi:hypothetical protein